MKRNLRHKEAERFFSSYDLTDLEQNPSQSNQRSEENIPPPVVSK